MQVVEINIKGPLAIIKQTQRLMVYKIEVQKRRIILLRKGLTTTTPRTITIFTSVAKRISAYRKRAFNFNNYVKFSAILKL